MEDWQNGPSAMDIGAVEEQQQDDKNDKMVCTPCEDQEVMFSMKGGGKGNQRFDGYCDFCGAWGHRKNICNKYTAYLQSMGKRYKGGTAPSGPPVKGGELMKGSSSSNGGSPGWQVKGGFSIFK